jgi:acyl-CoA synthetase (AMP-forming)/AMP-acid ligase II
MMAILARILAHDGDKTAVVVGDRAISYARLLADVRGAAALFSSQGVAEGTKVGLRAGPLVTGQTYASWIAHLAALWLGARHVSMVEAVSIAECISAGMVDIAIGSANGLKRVPATHRQIHFELDLAGPALCSGPPPLADDRAVRVNLTSGTTGRAKFVAWDSAMIDQRVAQVADGLPLSSTTTLYPLLQLRTTAGFRYPLAVWQAGGSVLLPEANEAMARDKQALGNANLLLCSPPQLEDRLRAYSGEWQGKDGRTIITLGGRLGSAVRDDALARAGRKIFLSYGATETGSIAIGDAATIDRHPGAVGFIRDGVEVEIVGDDGRRVPPGTSGRVRTRSAVMANSYESIGSGSADPGPFQGGWFVSGDIGCLFDDGLLAIEGRSSDTFNLGGWKVNALELEHRVRIIRGVDDICACVMQLQEGDLLTFALVCGDDRDIATIAGQIRALLPKGRRFHVVRVRALPRNAMGKIPRAQIARQLTQAYDAKKQNVANA